MAAVGLSLLRQLWDRLEIGVWLDERVAELLVELIRRVVHLRWEKKGGADSLMLVLDSTVILR